MRTQAPAIGPVHRGNRDRPAFAVRVPVLRGEPAEPRFVLSAVVEPNNLRDLLFTAGLPQGWLESWWTAKVTSSPVQLGLPP
jgi:hypothetical protein